MYTHTLPLPTSFRLSKELSVWLTNIDLLCPDYGLLDPSERERMGRMRFPKDAERFAARRTWLRQILAEYVDGSSQTIKFSVGTYGKPIMTTHRSWKFSISSSNALAVCVVSKKEVGIDIEARQTLPSFGTLFESISTENERGTFPQTPDGFYALWTAKEAILKCWGVGLSVAPNSVEVTSYGQGKYLGLEVSQPKRWNVAWLRLSASYTCAVAIEDLF